DTVERTRHLPDLLDAQRPDLRILTRQTEPIESNTREMPLRSLGEHRHAGDDVGAGLEVTELLPLAAAALVAGAYAANAPVGGQQLHGGRLGQDHRAALLSLFRQPAAEPRERRDHVARVLHRRRRG